MSPRLKALMRLGVKRQATPDDVTLQVYLEDLASESWIDDELVDRACRALANEPRREFDSAFPSFGDVLAQCQDEQAQRAKERRDALIAPMPVPAARQMVTGNEREMTRDEAAKFLDEFRRRVEHARQR